MAIAAETTGLLSLGAGISYISRVSPIDFARFEIILREYSGGSLPDCAIRVQQPQPCLARALRSTLSISAVHFVTKRFAFFAERFWPGSSVLSSPVTISDGG